MRWSCSASSSPEKTVPRSPIHPRMRIHPRGQGRSSNRSRWRSMFQRVDLPTSGQAPSGCPAEARYGSARSVWRNCAWPSRTGGRSRGSKPLDCEVQTADAALRELVRSRLEGMGPVTAAELGRPLELTGGELAGALAALEVEGFAMRGQFSASAGGTGHAPPGAAEEWCDRAASLPHPPLHLSSACATRSNPPPSPNINGSCSVGRAWAWSGAKAAKPWARYWTSCKVWRCRPAAWEREILPGAAGCLQSPAHGGACGFRAHRMVSGRTPVGTAFSRERAVCSGAGERWRTRRS